MEAVTYTRYGPPEVLRFMDVDKPIPKGNEVLIRVHATSVTNADCFMRRAETITGRIFLGIRRPKRKILGTELAGVIEGTGKNVTRFKTGDKVFGFTGFGLGAYAEYSCMPEKGSLVMKPEALTFEEAAAMVDGPSTALYFLRDKANIRSGQKVLILGASGSIGTSAVQLARHFGAYVTGVCSGANLDLVRSLGADRVIDYRKEDFTKNGETYDIIFDTIGKSSFSLCRSSLNSSGCYITTTGSLVQYLRKLWTYLVGGKRSLCGMSIDKTDSLIYVKGLIEAGGMRPVIDRRYRLEQMADAHRYVEQGHKKGNVVVTVGDRP
jgi:NADPH:quinone reductase-like Zn-dependent oxidoreductase